MSFEHISLIELALSALSILIVLVRLRDLRFTRAGILFQTATTLVYAIYAVAAGHAVFLPVCILAIGWNLWFYRSTLETAPPMVPARSRT